jgi:hypothetical protein
MGYREVTQEQLAELAGAVFHDSPVEDIPDKLWIDYWPGGDQHYLRAVFDGSASGRVFEKLHELGQRINRQHDVLPVCVVYSGDYSWSTIEDWVMRLRRVA